MVRCTSTRTRHAIVQGSAMDKRRPENFGESKPSEYARRLAGKTWMTLCTTLWASSKTVVWRRLQCDACEISMWIVIASHGLTTGQVDAPRTWKRAKNRGDARTTSSKIDHRSLSRRNVASLSFLPPMKKAQELSHLGFLGCKSLTMTYFHTGTRTIIGAESFHCPVRDGKEWDQLAMVIRHKGLSV